MSHSVIEQCTKNLWVSSMRVDHPSDSERCPLQIFGGKDVRKLMRIHLARLMPGSKIRIHRDHGGYTAEVGPSGRDLPVHRFMRIK